MKDHMTGSWAAGILLGALVLSAPAWAAAEDEDEPHTTVTVDPGGLILGNRIGIEFERALSSIASVYVEPKVVVGSISPPPHSVTDGLWGGDLAVGFRFFFTGDAPRGLYAGPQVDAAWVHGNVSGQDTGGYRLAAGALVGYSYLLADIIDLSVGAGALYRFDHVDVGSTPSSTQGIVPTVRLAFGIAF